MEMGGGMQYTLLKRTGATDSKGRVRSAGGITQMMTPVPLWLAYVAVESADATTDKAKRLGAMVTVPPTDIPNVGRFACYLDPQQAPIAVLQPKM
jgi:predicted enzyme related to lactoylglutathione lyase